MMSHSAVDAITATDVVTVLEHMPRGIAFKSEIGSALGGFVSGRWVSPQLYRHLTVVLDGLRQEQRVQKIGGKRNARYLLLSLMCCCTHGRDQHDNGCEVVDCDCDVFQPPVPAVGPEANHPY